MFNTEIVELGVIFFKGKVYNKGKKTKKKRGFFFSSLWTLTGSFSGLVRLLPESKYSHSQPQIHGCSELISRLNLSFSTKTLFNRMPLTKMSQFSGTDFSLEKMQTNSV